MRLTLKWRPIVAQEIDVVELVEPVGVVDHNGVDRRRRPKLRNLPNTDSMPPILAAISASVRSLRASSLPEGSPTLVVPPPISTIGRWPACCNLRSIMMLTQVADMEARRRAVEADIAGDGFGAGELVERCFVGHLVNVAPGLKLVQELRFGGAHA